MHDRAVNFSSDAEFLFYRICELSDEKCGEASGLELEIFMFVPDSADLIDTLETEEAERLRLEEEEAERLRQEEEDRQARGDELFGNFMNIIEYARENFENVGPTSDDATNAAGFAEALVLEAGVALTNFCEVIPERCDEGEAIVAEIEDYVGNLSNMAEERIWQEEEEVRLRQEEELRRQEEEAAARETCEAAESQWIMENVSGLPNQGGNNAPNRFVLYTENKSHHDADVFCRQNGGYLAAIQSEADVQRAFDAAAAAGTQL